MTAWPSPTKYDPKTSLQVEIALAITAGAFIGAVLGFVGRGGAMLSVPGSLTGSLMEPF
jgi:uncharacterized membrane protein YfcA